jgi:hypothetical protein
MHAFIAELQLLMRGAHARPCHMVAPLDAVRFAQVPRIVMCVRRWSAYGGACAIELAGKGRTSRRVKGGREGLAKSPQRHAH